MPKKIKIPFIHHDGVEVMDGYDTSCAGLGIINDKELKQWRLIHLPSGYQVGRFRTRAIALRAADLHNDIGVDWTLTSDELREDEDRYAIAIASVAACSIAEAEDQVKRMRKESEAAEQDANLS